MNEKEKIAARLAPLDGIELSADDIAYVADEIKDFERVVAELEEFARDIPWIAHQTHPAGKKA